MNKHGVIKTCTSILALCLLLLSAQAAQAGEKVSNGSRTRVNYLFVQSAGKLKLEADKNHPDTYKIILKKVNPYVTYFSERPYKSTSTMPVETFTELWYKKNKEGFLHIPPNASLVAIESGFFSEDTVLNLVVELAKPQYDAQSKTLTYTAKLLKTKNTPKIPKGTFEHVFLFIDEVCLSCWGG